ncbi:hypothetical protein [Terrisporobacter mayombei]|uniref:Uncharacterized protein n=1 Tax=Terrisporobacter mayombei TaxID=1541 RepID=A0ABY9Q082_9FIRM|nr:hypothetical protein [Terrisporobacter mayombei]MCC3868508.1 hypothetical protein [Terrisporobacter mayombei]WMT80664.1 hypothetical protein TEMA_09850 [Terrisporobacter mayombei]
MLDVEKVKVLLLEEKYPYFSDEQLESLCDMYDDMNELCFIACKMKADGQDVTIGPITIKNNSNMWNNLADAFYKKWVTSSSSKVSKSLTGKCAGRSDEY